jgi:CHASE2 domain-containing sensor protein
MLLRAALSTQKEMPDSNLAVIAIDAKSESEWGAWPWPHGMFTSPVEIVTNAGANAVGLLIWFKREGDNRELADALRHEPVFLLKVPVTASGGGESIPQIKEWGPLPSKLQETTNGASFAYSNLDTTEDLYKIQLLAQGEDGTYHYSLDLWLICQHLGIDIENLSDGIQLKENFWQGKYLQIQSPDGHLLRIPIDNSGQMLVDFSTPCPVYDSFTNVLDMDDESHLKKYQNKIVLVGVTIDRWAEKTRFGPLTELELHARAIDMMLSGRLITRLSPSINWGYIMLMCVVFALVLSRLDEKKRRGKLMLAIFFCLGLHTFIAAIAGIRGILGEWVNPTVAIFSCGGITAMISYHLDLRKTHKVLQETHEELIEIQSREIALEGIIGLALEMFEGSHRARSQTRIPFPIRLRLHTRIVQNWYEHFVSDSPDEEASLSKVVREGLKQAFKYRCEGYVDVEQLMSQIDRISDGGEVSIEVPNYIGTMTCYLSNPHPINVRKPYMLQAVLKSLIDNALKSLRQLREKDTSAKAELRITSCVSEDDYTITIYDSGEPLNEKTIQLLQQPQKALIKWMKERLEALETEHPKTAEKSYRNLPVGLGLLLSQLILTEFYKGRMQIKNEPEKSVLVRFERASMAGIDEKKKHSALE